MFSLVLVRSTPLTTAPSLDKGIDQQFSVVTGMLSPDNMISDILQSEDRFNRVHLMFEFFFSGRTLGAANEETRGSLS